MKSTKIFLFLICFCGVQLSYAQEILTLDQAIQVALQKNFDVRVLQNTASSALNDRRYSVGLFLPQLNANGSYQKPSQDSRSVTASNVETIRKGVKSVNTNAQVSMTWTLFDGTKMFATRKRFAEAVSLAEINVKNQMMNSVALVINNYFNIVRQKQLLRATAELTAYTEERVRLAELKLQVGTGAKPELLQAKVDLNVQRTNALAQETLVIQLKDQMNQLLGMSISNAFDVSDSIPIDLTVSREGILGTIANTNQALASAQQSIAVAKASLWEARALRTPTVNLTGNYSFQKQQNTQAASPVSLLFSQNKGYNYGLSVSLPILNGFSTQRTVNFALINVERAKLVYDQQASVAITAVRNAYTNYDNSKKILFIEEENILLAKENANIALEGSRRGLYTFIEVRTAQQSLSDAYNRLIAARYNTKLSETELFRLNGDLVK